MLKRQINKKDIYSKMNVLMDNKKNNAKSFVLNYKFISTEKPNKFIDKAYDILFEVMEANEINSL
jgi:hypothetical protein